MTTPESARSGGGTDRITLTGLRVRGFHGVFAHERRDGQDFVVDVILHLDTRPAAGSDDLDDTVDYGSLAVDLADAVRGQPLNLIETLAGRLALMCLSDPRVHSADVVLHKPSAPIPEAFADVMIVVRRNRADLGESAGQVATAARPVPGHDPQRPAGPQAPQAQVPQAQVPQAQQGGDQGVRLDGRPVPVAQGSSWMQEGPAR